MDEKNVTEMVIKADLQCDCCYKKIRKLLSGYPEIRDWIFDEDNDTVTITVTGCDPETLRYKLSRNSRGVIKGIEIKQQEEPKPKEATPPPAQPEQPEPAAKEPEPVKQEPEPAPKTPEPSNTAVEPEMNQVEPVQCFGSRPMPIFCMHCFGGQMVGPWNGFGGPPVHFEGYFYGRVGYGFGPHRPNHCSHSNPAGGRH